MKHPLQTHNKIFNENTKSFWNKKHLQHVKKSPKHNIGVMIDIFSSLPNDYVTWNLVIMTKIMKIVILLCLFLFACGQIQPGFVAERISRTETINPNKFAGVDFSTFAKEVNYTVTCTQECNIYLLTYAELKKFENNQPFDTIVAHENVTHGSGHRSSPLEISKRLIVVVVNRNASPLQASFVMEQLVPMTQMHWWIWIAIGVGCSALLCCYILSCLCCCCCCGNRRSEGYQLVR